MEIELQKFDFGIVDFKEYQKYNKVENKDWVKSIIVFVFPYAGKKPNVEGYLSAKYAYGKDYHQVIKATLEAIAQEAGFEKYEVLSDISFLDEKLCAKLAGLGVIGKNNLLLHPVYGSRVLIGEIITSEELKANLRIAKNPCLNCSLCIKACPTKALDDGFKKENCLSFLSQTKGRNYALYDKMELFVGCDICQDVCPTNKKEQLYLEEFRFDGKSNLTLEKLALHNQDSFKNEYQDKAFSFLGFLKILRNILVLEAKNKQLCLSDLEKYEKLTDEGWFKGHLQYLKGRIKNGKD